MNAICCTRTEEQTVQKILAILKPYLRTMKNDEQKAVLIKKLIAVNSDFRELVDIYIEE